MFYRFLSFSVCKCDILVQHFEGERATLPCKYDSRYHGKCHICWMKGEIPNMGCGDEIIASDGDKVVRRTSHRYQLTGDIPHGDVSLTISNIQKKDSGKYGCRIHVPGWFNDETYNVNLIVKDGKYLQQNTVNFLEIIVWIVCVFHHSFITDDFTSHTYILVISINVLINI